MKEVPKPRSDEVGGGYVGEPRVPLPTIPLPEPYPIDSPSGPDPFPQSTELK